MRSITQAMLWESSRHWYWLAIGFVLGAFFPFLSLLSLRSLGMPPDAPELMRLQMLLVPFHCMCLILHVIAMQGPPQRLYGYPVSNEWIASWTLVSGVVYVGMGVAITLWWFNLQFQVAWPILGPSLYAAMSFAVVQPFRVSHKTLFQLLGVGGIVIMLVIGFVALNNGMSKTPQPWVQPTVPQVLAMIGICILSLFLSVQSVALDRHGEDRKDYILMGLKQLQLGLWFRTKRDLTFENGIAAHLWSLWRSHIQVYTTFGILFLIAGGVIYYWQSDTFDPFKPDPRLRLELIIALNCQTFLALVFGLVLGMLNADSSNSKRAKTLEESIREVDSFTMGSFLSALPMSSEQLSRTILLSSARGSFILAIALLLMLAVLSMVKVDLISGLWRSSYAGWYWLALILLPWSVMTNAATVGLFGRARLYFAAVFILVGWIVLIGLPTTQLWAAIVPAILVVIVAVGSCFVGFKRRCLSLNTIAVAWSAWLVLGAVIGFASPIGPSAWSASWIVLLTTMAILPCLLMPVAISFNRCR